MEENKKQTAVALGYFDGLHIAHRQVLEAAKTGAAERDLTPGVLLFDRPPAEVVRGVQVRRLMTDEDRDDALKTMGFTLMRISFAAIRDLSPEDFVTKLLRDTFAAKLVACGYNYRFGRSGAGNAETLRRLGEGCGIETVVVGEQDLSGAPVSSSRIRALIEDGKMAEANALLGRPLSFCSPVFDGDHRGRLLGSPTINQFLPEGFIVPKFGVYVSEVELADGVHRAVTNIGARPTFDGKSVRSETFILGFSGDLYGQTVRVRLLSFLRPEMKFPSVEALKARIAIDAENAVRYSE